MEPNSVCKQLIVKPKLKFTTSVIFTKTLNFERFYQHTDTFCSTKIFWELSAHLWNDSNKKRERAGTGLQSFIIIII